MKSFCSFVLVCMFCLITAACDSAPTKQSSNASQNKPIEIIFIPKVTGNAFFESANDGVQIYAAKYGFTVTYEGSPIALVDKQLAIIEEAIAKKVNAICISALDVTALDSSLKKAMAAGIQVVTWDSDVSPDARTLMVSQGTPVQLGKMLVEMGAKSLQQRGLDPSKDTIEYVWHYSQPSVADQNSWNTAGEQYISDTYPNWVNVAPDNYYSQQDPEKAVAVGKAILQKHPSIDLIICNDSTSLPGQTEALQQAGLTAKNVTITGFASPKAMKEYCKKGLIDRWGLWDCQVQASLANYLAYYLASGNKIRVGDRLNVPEIGLIEVMPNSVLGLKGHSDGNSGVVLLPQRSEFTIVNVDNFDF